jgi:diguanylate cyclase (GGDEF)-like protein/PAS domain S-box-containing protein
MAEMFGCSVSALIGCEMLALVHPTQREDGRQKMQALLTQAVPSIDLDRRYWRADQTEFWGHVTSRCLPDTSGEKNGIVGVIIDITERKRMEEQVHQLAFYDPLTQLPNRRLLDDRLSQTLAAVKRSPRYGALMFLDLDNFKALNDTQGHAVGDLLLMELAVRLKSCVREMDTVARFGGDEFVVMISELGVEEPESTLQASSIAEKIRSALTAPYVLKVQRDGKTEKIVEHRCTASIGVALFGKHESNQEQILMQADRAMYQAKETGSNLIRFYGSKT